MVHVVKPHYFFENTPLDSWTTNEIEYMQCSNDGDSSEVVKFMVPESGD